MPPFSVRFARRARPAVSIVVLLTAFALASCVGCGGLGKLRSEDVAGAIESAQASVADARERDLTTSAKPSLNRAEYKLAEAHSAFRSNRGVDALRAAQEAQFEARQAIALDDQADAFQLLLSDELEQYRKLANLLETAQSEAEAQRLQAQSVQTELNLLTMRLQTLESEYQRQLADALSYRQHAEERARVLEHDLQANRDRAARLGDLYETAKSQQQNAESQVRDIQQRIKTAESEVTAAQQLAQRRAQETQSVKQQAKELASAYSQRIETMQRESAKDSAIRRARETAAKAHPTAQVSATDLNDARSVVQTWKRAWDTGNLAAHLESYAANVRGERVNVVKGKEVRRTLSRAELQSEIRGVDRRSWQELGAATVGAEGNSVISQIAYRRKDGSSETFNFLIRKSSWQKSGAEWRVVSERLQYYNDVPNFSKR